MREMQQIQELLAALAQRWDPASAERSRRTKSEQVGAVQALAGLPDVAPEASRLSLEALARGMRCGVWDGANLFRTGTMPEPLARLKDGALAHQVDLLQKSVERTCEVARQNWSRMAPEDLELLSEYGKQQNLATGEEGLELAARPQTSLLDFQIFLLATFKAGYAIGMVDAVLVFAEPQPHQ